ncbi:hypothetical protein AWC05_14330 [Mycobacterium florentinum]|uniref:Uncharacterized protein n=1 Tax=Mycobacterium florentinum TaxID=292462 RepID=A0A1X1UE17_MYCFL|nr:hypothetical protein [Mycobacterium florentinum]MCV7411973.1 hypothetical protein [Mycobacterium florentinum]ORV55041.1 hypothetical protein AWC05_14330 [Mycobacterium florentinum]
MPRELFGEFGKLTQQLDAHPTLASRLERITTTLIAVPDHQVPDAIRWGSETLADIPLTHDDGSTEPLFPRYSVHDIRIDPFAYRWTKLTQFFLLLKHHTAAEVIATAKANPDKLAFRSTEALLEGPIFGGHYFVPLLANMSPSMWGIAAPRTGQVIVYTFGRVIGGNGLGASRDQRDALQILTHHNPAHDFDTKVLDETQLHKAAFSEAVDWWAGRINNTLRDIFTPVTYVDTNDFYLPDAHQRWMLNFEQLVARVGAILRHPRDQGAQLMLMYQAMDILGDSIMGSGGIGQLMLPSRIRKAIEEIEEHVPDRIKPLIMAPAYRALEAADQVADEFIVSSPNPNATTESRLTHLWNALRNTTHGFNKTPEILAEHSCRLPADIVLVPAVYLLDIITDRDRLLAHIRRTCR